MSQCQNRVDALFVHLSWKTRDQKPLLANEQIRQAVYQAIASRARTQFCHVLALGGTNSEVHAIFRFPASLQVSCIARISMQASAQTMIQFYEILHATQITGDIWENQFSSQTLNAQEAADAEAYLLERIEHAVYL